MIIKPIFEIIYKYIYVYSIYLLYLFYGVEFLFFSQKVSQIIINRHQTFKDGSSDISEGNISSTWDSKHASGGYLKCKQGWPVIVFCRDAVGIEKHKWLIIVDLK